MYIYKTTRIETAIKMYNIAINMKSLTVGQFLPGHWLAKTEFWEWNFQRILPILQFSAKPAAPKKLHLSDKSGHQILYLNFLIEYLSALFHMFESSSMQHWLKCMNSLIVHIFMWDCNLMILIVSVPFWVFFTGRYAKLWCSLHLL